ncbi:flap endonuclease-1 [Halorutilales archaeon Cl-col2-1]
MGADIGSLVSKREIQVEEASGKVGMDAFNTLYSFLANIRQRDGTPLKDSKGRVTSHLSGLLYRNANLFEAGIKPCYVFDGAPPQLKSETVEKRQERREEAEEAYEEAKQEGDTEEMFRRAQQATSIREEEVETSIKLLDALNIPWVEAPSEGEAQAAAMVVDGDLDYVGSQDYDAVLFGAPELVRNLAVRGKGDRDLTPELVSLEDTLDSLGMTRSELIEVAILVGTDYNDGVHGVGPKTAVDLIRDEGMSIDEALDEYDAEIDWKPIKDLYLDPEVERGYDLDWGAPDEEEVVDLLCGEHDFSEDRVRSAVGRISSSVEQSSLDRWT